MIVCDKISYGYDFPKIDLITFAAKIETSSSTKQFSTIIVNSSPPRRDNVSTSRIEELILEETILRKNCNYNINN